MDEATRTLYLWLLGGSRQADDPQTRLYARLLATRAGRGQGPGLGPVALGQLLQQYFPAVVGRPLPLTPLNEHHLHAGYEAQVQLLQAQLEQRIREPSEVATWLARIIAEASVFKSPLWRSLGLANQQQLEYLLQIHFQLPAGVL